MKRLDNNRPMYNLYYEASSSSIIRVLMGGEKEKLYHGEWAELVVGDTPHMVVCLSRRDAAASPSQTTAVDITTGGLELKGSVEPGFYIITELTDGHPDGLQYKAFCNGRKLYRCTVDFSPVNRLRIDRRVKHKPVTSGELESLLERATHDKDLKKALSNLLKEEDKKEEKKRNSNPPRPAEI